MTWVLQHADDWDIDIWHVLENMFHLIDAISHVTYYAIIITKDLCDFIGAETYKFFNLQL